MLEDSIKIIKEFGIPLHEQGINNWALSRDIALQAIQEVDEKGVIILGGDVLIKNGCNYEHNYDNWYYDPDKTLSKKENSALSIRKTKSYLENYPKDKNTYFVFVIQQ